MLFAVGDVMRETVKHDGIGIPGPPEGEFDGKGAPVTMLREEFKPPAEQGLLSRGRQLRQAATISIAVAILFRQDQIRALTTDRLAALPSEDLLGLRVPVGDDPALVDLDVGVVGCLEGRTQPLLGPLQGRLSHGQVLSTYAQQTDDKQRRQRGERGEAVLVGHPDKARRKSKADGGLTRGQARRHPGGDHPPREVVGNREIVPGDEDIAQGERRPPPGHVHQGGGHRHLHGDPQVEAPPRRRGGVHEMHGPRAQVTDRHGDDQEPQRLRSHDVEPLEPPEGNRCRDHDGEDEAGDGKGPFMPDTGENCGWARDRDGFHHMYVGAGTLGPKERRISSTRVVEDLCDPVTW